MFTVCAEIGLCGFGYDRGLINEVRCGVFRLMWCRGSLIERIRGWRKAIGEAANELRLLRGDTQA